MNLHACRVLNFRRLKDVHIDFEKDVSIFVGANNSGKTSAAHLLQMFMACSRDRFSINDFSAECWRTFDELGRQEGEILETAVPRIRLDLWFEVQAIDLYRVIDLLPNLDWAGSQVGLRIEFGPASVPELFARFREAKMLAAEQAGADTKDGPPYHPWPETLTKYLAKRLVQEFDLRYYVLDQAHFNDSFRQKEGYSPTELLQEKGRSGPQILKTLLRVDCLNAQRHLSDADGGGRAEDLSRRLSRFYRRNLKQRENDYATFKALVDSETQLNEHLTQVFAPTLAQLENLGYPGLDNPRLLIRSALDPETIMSGQSGARVHYLLDGPPGAVSELPDRYNGLGFKNLIYMVVELLDIHASWAATEEDRPPLHLIFVEEPEAHLHVQLQQVFIRQVFEILRIVGDDAEHYSSQLVVTTHSPHILYESGFKSVRYFKRGGIAPAAKQTSEVLNLSAFHTGMETAPRDFLERYLKLTHCDLFFADAAVLVEGNVERLLMPLMIERAAASLRTAYVCVLEIGGAFAHRFKPLIDFLGITTLVVTDIDSVLPPTAPRTGEATVEQEEVEEVQPDGAACPVGTPNAVTSNQTLISWLPKKHMISDLLAATPEMRTQEPTATGAAHVRIVYQRTNSTTWKDETKELAGRTLEEAFALENLPWCQATERKALKLRIPKNESLGLDALADRIYSRIRTTAFNKSEFALRLLADNYSDWSVPTYIADGLKWLADRVAPTEPPSAPASQTASEPKV